MGLVCKVRITSNELETLYYGHIAKGSILCADSHKSYTQFANDLSLEHKRIKRGKHKYGLYHIQHINAIHRNLKKWMNRFNGIATKNISAIILSGLNGFKYFIKIKR